MMKVSELMAKLAAAPQDAIVVIDDADTGWQLHVQTVTQESTDNLPVIAIRGAYDERFAE